MFLFFELLWVAADEATIKNVGLRVYPAM